MGNCVAGGAYLPVLCDTVLMTEGSGLYLAGPALVKAAIGQEVSHEDLGGAAMHAAISGTVDYHEPDDASCLARLRRLVALLPPDPTPLGRRSKRSSLLHGRRDDLFSIVKTDPSAQYDVRDLLAALVDGGRFDEYRAEYGQTLVCGFARLGGMPVGIVANQRLRFRPEGSGPFQFGGVIYADSADKAARFVLDCNQSRVPLLFLQDVNGFDVGRDAERSGIIRRGAKLVNAVSNSVVPKITLARRPLLRRGPLRPLRQGVRPAVPLRLAGRPLRRDGRRAGGADDARRQRRHPEAAGQGGRRRRAGRDGRGAPPPLRSRDRHPLRRRPRLGRRDHRPGRDPRRADPEPGHRDQAGAGDSGRFSTGVFQV